MRILTSAIARNAYLAQNIGPFITALVGAAIAAANMAWPNALLEHTSLGRELALPAELAWAVLATAGGIAACWGILTRNRSLEAAGFGALAMVWLLDAAAVFSYRGLAEGNITGGQLTGLGLAYAARTVVLLWIGHTQREILADLVEEVDRSTR